MSLSVSDTVSPIHSSLQNHTVPPDKPLAETQGDPSLHSTLYAGSQLPNQTSVRQLEHELNRITVDKANVSDVRAAPG